MTFFVEYSEGETDRVVIRNKNDKSHSGNGHDSKGGLKWWGWILIIMAIALVFAAISRLIVRARREREPAEPV